ncbi:uncharacterized protein LOC125681889 [Ostrea edulis]|uniref:uncharacterized protein LOC125681889 n=1 Tax=Ostrea edulis TaxID=37623 RepID=UPI0024AF453C|nr:uncharacterized protein LOC125681889 [Ostrea edulis]
MYQLFDDYGIINNGDVINGFTVQSVKYSHNHLCQLGDLYKGNNHLSFVCGAVTEIKEYLIRGGNNETFNNNNNNRGLILSFADDCDMEPESSLSKCFEIAFEKVLLSTNSMVVTNGFSSYNGPKWSKIVQRVNNNLVLSNELPIQCIGIINWNEIVWGPGDFSDYLRTLDSDLHHLFISQQSNRSKQQEYHTMNDVEDLLSQENDGLSDKEIRLPRVLVVYGGKLHALRKVMSALLSSTPVVVIKNSGGVADILCQMKSQGDESRVEKYIRFFEEQDASDAYQIIEKLKKKRKFIDSVLVTEVEEFGSNVFRAAFIEEFKEGKNVFTTRMCENVLRSGSHILLSILKHPDLFKHMDGKLTKRMLLFLYNHIPRGAQILSSLKPGVGIETCNEEMHQLQDIAMILKNQLQIKKNYYKLPVEDKMTYRDLFVWYLLTEQTQVAVHVWMQSNVLPIWDALLCSFILDGMEHIIYGQKTISRFKQASREYVNHATSILHECYISETYPDAKDIVEHVLIEKPYEIFQKAYNRKKAVFLRHKSVQDILRRRWYGKVFYDNQMFEVMKIVQAVLSLIFLPFGLLLLPFLSLFSEKNTQQIMDRYNTAFIKCFYFNASYTAFMCALTVTVSTRVSIPFSWADLMLLVWSACFALDEGRQIVAAEGTGMIEKFRNYISWRNTVDLANIILFFVGMTFKYFSASSVARFILVVNLLLFFLRILDLTSISQRLGVTYVVIKALIVKDLIPFLFIVFIVSVAFGLADLALLNKNIQLSWTLAEHAIMKQYWILHGDNSVDDFDIESSTISVRLVPYLRGLSALLLFVLLFNILIAIFTERYQNIITQSQMHWLNNFKELIADYDEKPIFPPPFVMFYAIHVMLFTFLWFVTIPLQACSNPIHKYSSAISKIFCECKHRRLKRGLKYFVKFYLSSAVKHRSGFTAERVHVVLTNVKKNYIQRLMKSELTTEY